MNKASKRTALVGEKLANWLLDSDPSVRWQVMRDLFNELPESFNRERERVATSGWGAELLARQRPDGKWGDDGEFPFWNSTMSTLVLLMEFGLEPDCREAKNAIERVRERVTWGPEFGDSPFFEGEVEPCINGRILALGAYFGHPSSGLLKRLLNEQLEDGGWNCEAERGSLRSSFHSTICVLEGLVAYERAVGKIEELSAARRRGEEYLLSRQMLRRLSTGERIHDRKGEFDWTKLVFPTTWHYDILRGLEYFRSADVRPDNRTDEALKIISDKQQPDGTWLVEHRYPDPVGLQLEGETGTPSRWNTLRALRVIEWKSWE